MKIGIMQPYFFPYLGHFSLINSTEKWIFFDVTQYTKKSWISRNRVLNSFGWSYINIPLANSSTSIKIKDAKILNYELAVKNIFNKLVQYKKIAPYYHQTIALLNDIFENFTNDYLSEFNIFSIIKLCEYFNIDLNYEIASNLKINKSDINKPGDWALNICKSLDAKKYINPISGVELFDQSEFNKSDIELYSHQYIDEKYDTGVFTYSPSMSIIDVMMWNSTKQINDLIKRNTVELKIN